MTRHSAGSFMETVRTIVYAVLIAIVVRTFAYEPFNIPSGSMKPTLLVGDYLFVKKWVYGYSRHSLPFSWPPFSGRIWSAPVERGDIVVYKVPTDNKTDYIKRIVGLPGDRIQVIGGILHINGQAVQREPIEDWIDEQNQVYHRYVETLPNGVQHVIIEQSDDEPRFNPDGTPIYNAADNTKEYTIPPGHYFGMGDNRDNSADSRAWGFIPEQNLVGRASFIFYSTAAGNLWPVWEAVPDTRWDRLMSGIH
jgi:signal peptidase I